MRRSRVLRRCIAGLALGRALLVDARGARAAPSLDLTWNVPRDAEAKCPDRASMIAAVGRLVVSPAPQGVHVEAAVREEGGQWIVELAISGAASGTRTLHAATCPSVARGAVLIVALALDPHAALAADEPEPPAAGSPPQPPSPTPPAPRPADDAAGAASPRSPGAPVRPVVFLGASLGHAVLPGLAPGAVAGGGILAGALRADLAIELAPPAHVALARLPAVGADVSFAAVALRACVGHAVGWVAFHGCAAVRGVRVAGEGTGVAEAYRQTAQLVLVEPGALVRAPARTPLAAELDVAAVVPLTRPELVMASGGTSERLFRASPLGARVGLAASFRF